MAVGDWHRVGDREPFQETLHGPLIETVCHDCGDGTTMVQDPSQRGVKPPRCSACLRRLYGVA